MAQSESDSQSESCIVSHVDDAVAQIIQSDLKDWCASSVDDFKAVETTRQYKFATPPNWTCIICEQAIRDGPVFQCMQGHLGCYECSGSGTSCKACSNAISRIKNLEIQKVMDATLATCKYASLGCTEVIKLRDLDDSDHEKTCVFEPMACPMPECHQVGVKNLFSQHLLAKHDIDVGLVVDLKKGVFESSWRSSDFEFNPSTKVVLLREINEEEKHVPRYNYGRYETRTEFHLLHQENMEFHDKLHITPLIGSSKREYELEVKIDNSVTYTLKGKHDMQLDLVLLLPKELGHKSLKKDCHVRSY